MTSSGELVSYATLDANANRLARVLQGYGVKRGSVVAVDVSRSSTFVLVVLAVLRAGAAYLPIDPSISPDRKEQLYRLANPDFVFYKDRGKVNLPESAIPVYCADALDAMREKDPSDLVVSRDPEDVFYITFTSGSTGRPKGVVVPDRAIQGFFSNVDYASWDQSTISLMHSSLLWDGHLIDIFPTLLAGGTIYVSDHDTSDISQTAAAIVAGKVNTVFMSTGLLNQALTAHPQSFDTVKTLMFGGEKTPPSLMAKLRNIQNDCSMVLAYGPSECTAYVTAHQLAMSDRHADSLPIGRPVGDRAVYVLDAGLRPCGDLVEGELFVGGDSVALGYLGQGGQTAEKFLPDPFSGIPGSRMYRTGDVVRRRQDGVLEFVGRVDDQVKIRGFRVEPGEIETVLSQHETVRDCVVIALDTADGSLELAAYVVPRDETARQGTLLDYLRKSLPVYMVPSTLTFLDTLPLTTNGKTDKRALPAPDRSIQSNDAFVPPSTDTEKVIASIWEEVLNIQGVSATDNFFRLGGHSLLAVQAVHQIRQRTGTKIPLASFMDASTLSNLASITASPEEVL
jgi:amino acid adenylation domain-containing protein